MTSARRVELTPGEVAVLKKRALGEGGFQTFVKGLQARLQPDGSIDLWPRDIRRIEKACRHADGAGGFETQIGKVFGRALSDVLDKPGALL